MMKSAVLPPSLQEWTVCERNARLHHYLATADSQALMDLPDDRVPLQYIRLPDEVDWSAASGTPIARRLMRQDLLQSPAQKFQNRQMVGNKQRAKEGRRLRELPKAAGTRLFQVRSNEDNLYDRYVEYAVLKVPSLAPVLDRLKLYHDEMVEHLSHWNDVRLQVTGKVLHWLRGSDRAKEDSDKVYADISGTGTIKVLAWQKGGHLLAICHRKDVVYVYDYVLHEWSSYSLGHSQLQTSVRCLAWQPNSSSQLIAVGCAKVVLLWRVRGHRHQHGQGKFFEEPVHQLIVDGFTDISAMDWSPCGKYLVVGSGSSGDVLVWNVDDLEWTRLWFNMASTQQIRFSPDGLYVVITQRLYKGSGRLRILETCKWSETYINYDTPCRNLEWMPDSKCFLFTLHNKSEIHSIRLTHGFPSRNYAFNNTEKTELKSFDVETGVIECGGIIDKMSLSPSGTRLIISFAGEHVGAEYLMCLSVKIFGPYAAVNRDSFMEIGYIHGPIPLQEEADDGTRNQAIRATHVSFAQQYDKGALAAIAWNNGRISLFPFFFAQ